MDRPTVDGMQPLRTPSHRWASARAYIYLGPYILGEFAIAGAYVVGFLRLHVCAVSVLLPGTNTFATDDFFRGPFLLRSPNARNPALP